MVTIADERIECLRTLIVTCKGRGHTKAQILYTAHDFAKYACEPVLEPEIVDREVEAFTRDRINGEHVDMLTASGWPAAIDLTALAEREPEQPRFIVADWVPTGYATLLAGHGGVGK